MRRALRVAVAVCATLAATYHIAFAQDKFPTRPMHRLVSIAPGVGVEVVARVVGLWFEMAPAEGAFPLLRDWMDQSLTARGCRRRDGSVPEKV